jgi:hypothetical protein
LRRGRSRGAHWRWVCGGDLRRGRRRHGAGGRLG